MQAAALRRRKIQLRKPGMFVVEYRGSSLAHEPNDMIGLGNTIKAAVDGFQQVLKILRDLNDEALTGDLCIIYVKGQLWTELLWKESINEECPLYPP